MRQERKVQKKQRSAKLAAILSLIFPGIGQIYAGDLKRGLAFFFGFPVQVAMLYGAGKLVWEQWIPMACLLALVWLWNVVDAFTITLGRKPSIVAPVLAIIILNLIAASTVTQVRMPELKQEQRDVMGRIVKGLANPDFVTRKTVEQKALGKYIVPGPGASEPYTPVKRVKGRPYLQVSPTTVTQGENVKVVGHGFTPDSTGLLTILSADNMDVARVHTNENGSFTCTFKNPRDIPGSYLLQATLVTYPGGWRIGDTLAKTTPLMFETIYLALLGTAFSLVFAIPLSFLGARNLMQGPVLKGVYGVTRSLFTILRSVEVLIVAVVAAAAVGIGPFAGVIALAIHGIGALGKLYSEAIESIDHGPIEAIRATGASEFQVVIFAVVPQVVPQFIAFTLYRWDINVRMATVIGMVGGGGIGSLLIPYMKLLQWREAATAIWLIAGVVMLMDYASAVIREKII